MNSEIRFICLAGFAALLLAACGGTTGTDSSNNPEPLKVTVAGADTVEAGSSIELTATTAGDGADDATVTWTASEGTVTPDSGRQTTWTAPDMPGEYTIGATVTFHDASDSATHLVQVTASGDAGDPRDPTGPTDPTDPSNPDDPTDPGDPEDPTDPTDPTDPSDPNDPENPPDPSDPGEPEDPEDPEDPVEPEDPADPSDPDDPAPLTVSISGDSAVEAGDSITLSAVVTGDGADSANVAWSAEEGGFSTDTGMSTIWYSAAAPGNYTIQATVSTGAEPASAEHVVTVTPVPPTISIERFPLTVVAGEASELETRVSGTDADPAAVVWTASGGAFETDSGAIARWTAPADVDEAFTITASITVHGITVQDQVTITVSRPLPVLAIHGPDSAYYGETVEFTVTVDGSAPDENLDFAWSGPGTFLSTTADSVLWQAPSESGNQSIIASLTGEPAFVHADHDVAVAHCAGGAADDEADPCQIRNIEQLQAIGTDSNLSGHFVLANDIDASGTEDWHGSAGDGFTPLGKDPVANLAFTGSFDGQNFSINDLYIDWPLQEYVGLFSRIDSGARIENLRLSDVNITGARLVGALAGQVIHADAVITRVSVSGTVQAMGSSDTSVVHVGGLAGQASGIIDHSSNTATVAGQGTMVGGLVGHLTSTGIIRNSSSNAAVASQPNTKASPTLLLSGYAGGLVGMSSGTITDSDSDGPVEASAGNSIGGLVGILFTSLNAETATITGSYAGSSTVVTGNRHVGGLVGTNRGGVIAQSYSHAQSVEGTAAAVNVEVGGLVGALLDGGVIDETYSISLVLPEGGDLAGGLVGGDRDGTDGVVTGSYWATDDSGQTESAGGTGAMGRLRTDLSDSGTFDGWDFGSAGTWQFPRPVGGAPGRDPERLPDLTSNRRPLSIVRPRP